MTCSGMTTEGQDGVRRRGETIWSRWSNLGAEEEAIFGGLGDSREGEIRTGEEERRWLSSDFRDGRKGRKNGIERKWV